MSDGSSPAGSRAAPGVEEGNPDLAEWKRIERSPEFRELTSRRHRFLTMASIVFLGEFLLYLGLAAFAPGFMGTTIVGSIPVAWPVAMIQVLMTWAVTWAYLRKADREFEPLERRVAERAGARFTREQPAESAAAETPTERSAR